MPPNPIRVRKPPRSDRKSTPEKASSRPARDKAGKPAGKPAGRGTRPDRKTTEHRSRDRRRLPFSQENLAFRHEGDQGERLAEALRVPEGGGFAFTHGFHPWPGRFHSHLPRMLMDGLIAPDAVLLDPFMGGGTTLVEAVLSGRKATGNDLNPIATLVARERTRPRTPEQASRLTGEAERIAGLVEGLRREKNPPRARLRNFQRLTPHYQPHLLAEMTQWIRLIQELPPGTERESMQAVFSSAVVKFSNQLSDSRKESSPPSYPKGAVSRFMMAKTTELAEGQFFLGRKMAAPPEITLLQEDARLLPSLGWGTFDVILTSPPYPGTYDYHDQHRLRMDWLELEGGETFETEEIGARRQESGKAAERWSSAIADVLSTFARVLKPGGQALVVLGDWLVDGHPVDAAEALRRMAAAKGWQVVSRASVQRGVYSRSEKKAWSKKGKWEHLLMLTR